MSVCQIFWSTVVADKSCCSTRLSCWVHFLLLHLLKVHTGITSFHVLFIPFGLTTVPNKKAHLFHNYLPVPLSTSCLCISLVDQRLLDVHGFHCMFISLCLSYLPLSVSAGFGGCVDLIVDGVSLLNKIGLPPTDQPLHHDYIENTEQLAESFAYFFAPGAAAE